MNDIQIKSAWTNLHKILQSNNQTQYVDERRSPSKFRITKSEPRSRSYTSQQDQIPKYLIEELLEARLQDCQIDMSPNAKYKQRLKINGPILDLSNLNLKTKSAKIIGTILQHTNDFTQINISNNPIGDDFLIVARSLQYGTNRSIIHLDISKLGITSKGFKYIFDALKEVYSLISLNLSYNHISESATGILQEFIESHGNIQYLNLYQTFVRPMKYKMVAMNLGQNDFKTTKGIAVAEDLQLLDNYITDKGLSPMIKAINKWNLVILNLQNNQITLNGFTDLVEELFRHPTLKTLNLSQNNLSVEQRDLKSNGNPRGTYESFTKLLQNNKSLHTLILNDCKLSEFSKLSDGLADNVCLKVLNLSGNNIGLQGSKDLAYTLSNLEYLYLNHCQLGKGANDIIIQLTHSKITHLEVRENGIPDLNILVQLINHNPNIVYLDCRVNVVNFRLQSQIQDGLERNKIQQKKLELPKNMFKLKQLPVIQQELQELQNMSTTIEKKQMSSTTEFQHYQTNFSQVTYIEQSKTVDLEQQLQQIKEEYYKIKKLEDEIEFQRESFDKQYEQLKKDLKDNTIGEETQLNYQINNLKKLQLRKELVNRTYPIQIKHTQQELQTVQRKLNESLQILKQIQKQI